MSLSLDGLTLEIFLSFSVAKQYTSRRGRMLTWVEKSTVVTFSQGANHSCGCIRDHGKDIVLSTTYPLLMEPHHLQSFWKKSISLELLLSLSSYARFCPTMMMKSFSLWKKQSWSIYGDWSIYLWPEAPAAEVAPGPGGRSHWPQPLVDAVQHWRMYIPVPACLVVGQGEGPVTGNVSSCLPWGLTLSNEAAENGN